MNKQKILQIFSQQLNDINDINDVCNLDQEIKDIIYLQKKQIPENFKNFLLVNHNEAVINKAPFKAPLCKRQVRMDSQIDEHQDENCNVILLRNDNQVAQIYKPFREFQQIMKQNMYERYWSYVDELNIVRGPFTAIEMDTWFSRAFFKDCLLISNKIFKGNAFVKMKPFFQTVLSEIILKN